jgi:hypothetical protein
MAIEKNEAKTTKTGALVTPKGRLMYPSLFRARLMKGETDQSKAKFQVTLLIPKDADTTLLLKTVKERINSKWTPGVIKTSKIKGGFLQTKDDPKLEELADEFPTLIRTNATMAPGVFTSDVKPCKDETEAYAGRWARLVVNPWCYDHPVGGKGVSWELQHVQLLKHDEQLGFMRASAEESFEAVELDENQSAESVF